MYTTISSTQSIVEKLRDFEEKFASGDRVGIGLPADAGQHPTANMRYAKLGAIHEFGSMGQGIPERSFLRVPLRANQDQIAKQFRRLMKEVSNDEMTMTQALDSIGAWAVGIPQQAISEGISPDNAKETIDRKGSSQPLVDTGALRRAITWKLEQ